MINSRLKCYLVMLLPALCCACGGGGGSAGPAADTTAPEISFSGVSNGQKLSSGVSITLNASDSSGVTELRLSVDGEQVASSASGQINWYWNTAASPMGECTLSASASDGAGNTASRSLSVEVLNGIPAGAAVLPSAPAAAGEAAELFPILSSPETPAFFDPLDAKLPQPIIFGLQEGDRVASGVEVKITAQDDRGVEAICARVGDGQQWYSDSTTLNLNWDTTRQPDGPCVFNIYLLDRGLNVTLTEVRVEIVNQQDHDGPLITTNPRIGQWAYAYGPVNLVVDAADPSGIREIQLLRKRSAGKHELITSNQGQSSLSWLWDSPASTAGDYEDYESFMILATDNAGNQTRLDGSLRSLYGSSWGGEPRSRRTRLETSVPYQVELTRTIDRGGPAQVKAHRYSYSSPTDLELLEDPLSTEQLVPEFGAPEKALSMGLYHVRLSMDDYVMEWDSTLVNSQAELSFADPITWDETEPHLSRLPGMRWNTEEDPWGLLSAVGDDGDLLAAIQAERDDYLVHQYSSPAALLHNEAAMNAAKWIFIGSSADGAEQVLADPIALENLRSWVRDGGLFVATGDSYTIVEQLWPQRLAFSGADSEQGLETVPQDRTAVTRYQWPSYLRTPFRGGVGGDYPYYGVYIDASGLELPMIVARDERVFEITQAQPGPDGSTSPAAVGFGAGLGYVVYSLLPFNTPLIETPEPQEADFMRVGRGVLNVVERRGWW